MSSLPGDFETVELLLAEETPSDGSVRRAYVVRRLLRSPTFLTGLVIALFWIVAAVFTSWIAPRNPYAVDPLHTLQPPSGSHWFGTDELGRDVLSRVLAGSRPVLEIAPGAVVLALIGGTLTGLLSGYYGGWRDETLMRLIDVLLSLPIVVTAIVVLSLLGSSLVNVIVTIAILFIPLIARTIRSAVLAEREREYVQAAELRGERPIVVMFIEILPNITAPLIVEGTIRLGFAIFTAATLSFLGFGAQPPSPDWGLTIAQDRTLIQAAYWTVLFPALALGSLVVAISLMADGLRNAFRR